MIPYGKQTIDEYDVKSVIGALQSDYLTTGPKVRKFEEGLAQFTGSTHAVAVSSGTAALHTAMHGIGLEKEEEVIVPAISFVATSNCVEYLGATPVFADIDPNTGLIDPDDIEKKITENTKAVISMDYAGQPCDYDRISAICKQHGLVFVSDGCHSLGAQYKEKMVGSLADLTVFSFHPVKAITTGEGGAVLTDNPYYTEKMQSFRNHGINLDYKSRYKWHYQMETLGHNYRITDLQCALGLSQLSKLRGWVYRRNDIAKVYDNAFSEASNVETLKTFDDYIHAYHLYVVKVKNREELFDKLRNQEILVNVHYLPIYLHKYYRDKYGYSEGLCPNSELFYDKILSLPMFPSIKDEEVEDVICGVMCGAKQ